MQSERLNRLGEERGAEAGSGKGSNGCERDEDVTHSQGNPEESPCGSDDEGRDVHSPSNDPEDQNWGEVNAPPC